ncbi:MAG TPA: hypothetical protein VLY65_00780 [Nitrososphaerales archaeon]|nr:hypothetical protein [Nitrososphaerales archaeon]
MSELKQIPLALVAPHPKLATRIKLDVRPLAELIRGAVDEDVPNGQLEPGRVVPREDGQGYYVYIGLRRFYALKSLYEETRDKRFAVFIAYVDSSTRSLLDLFLRVRAENEEGKGERVGLSVLEKVYGLHRISGLVPLDKMDDELRRELAVAEKLDEKRIMKLFEIETAAHFSYRLEHLERLCQISDLEELYESAACIAGYAIPPERIDKAVEGREDGVRTLKWFGRLFPDYARSVEDRRDRERQSPVQHQLPMTEPESASEEPEAANGRLLEIHKTDVVIVPCPKCGAENMIEVRLKAEVTRLSADPEGETMTSIPEVVVGCAVECSGCQSGFHAFVKPLEGRRYALETSLSTRFQDPRTVVETVDLRFDFKDGHWQKLSGEKMIGVVRTSGRVTRN